ncbi:MAG: Tm-1-like ATP-binding domain-containing protein [Pyrinomonadaceae bacterium]
MSAHNWGASLPVNLTAPSARQRFSLPLRGVSAIDREDQPFYLPAADQALFDSLRIHVKPPVELIELDLHINDPEFAEAMATRLLHMMTANYSKVTSDCEE